MNEQQILELEKQLIPDLPKDFWKIRDQAEIEADFWDRLLYIGLAIGAVFQVICFRLCGNMIVIILPSYLMINIRIP